MSIVINLCKPFLHRAVAQNHLQQAPSGRELVLYKPLWKELDADGDPIPPLLPLEDDDDVPDLISEEDWCKAMISQARFYSIDASFKLERSSASSHQLGGVVKPPYQDLNKGESFTRCEYLFWDGMETTFKDALLTVNYSASCTAIQKAVKRRTGRNA
ncbi:hypothetical protein B0H13DRAFT_1902737 [Mycena leptocephala]|nr:hypothetical protein B0H13DRAFT_1902737 [Mycena leptocephala]